MTCPHCGATGSDIKWDLEEFYCKVCGWRWR